MAGRNVERERLTWLLHTMGEARVGVIGDFCLDVYWMLDMKASELSLETGLMTQPVRRQAYSLGGAGNVAANLRAIGIGTVCAFTSIGTDPFGARMLDALKAIGVDCSGVVAVDQQDAWQTLAYCKPYIGEAEQPRIDMGNFNALPDAAANEILHRLDQRLPTLDVVVVNEQVANGIHTPTLRRDLGRLMEDHPEVTFIFDGRHLAEGYPHAWLKINAAEAVALCGATPDPGSLVLKEDAQRAAQTLFARNGQPVFVTRGDRGCILCDDTGVHSVPGIQVIGPTDTVGAGDSFLAGLAAATAAGATRAEAMAVGNVAARVTVTKLRQTGTAFPEEILEVGASPLYVHEPEIADDPRKAHYLPDTHIEVVGPAPADLRLTCAIFDHDGTVSTLRQGWEEVMEPMMVRAVLGDAFATADESAYRRVVARAREFIDQTTGIQTLVQMQGLVEMVRDIGIVPADQILDMHQYKAIYDQNLMARVTRRIERLRKGELGRDDFTVKNAVAFLKALDQAGVVCFLASGTDEKDVRAEAAALGYDHLFRGGIYGAVGDINKEAKREVLERILAEVGDAGKQLVTFGDGPVEIRETQVRGGLAVGVASDEVRRFDLNPAKRARLIRAGAALVIPDFSEMQALLHLLGIAP